MSQLRVFKTSDLVVDPDVQLEFTLNQRRWRRMAAGWNPEFVHVLTTVPLNGGDGPPYSIVDGRHRLEAGEANGILEWRCDHHPDIRTVAEKAALKRALDRERRHVGSLEDFLEKVMAEDPVAIEIQATLNDLGYKVGSSGSNGPKTTIQGVAILYRIHSTLGVQGLRRVFALNSHWRDEPSTNTSDWIGALGLLVRDGYDQVLTPPMYARLDAVVPAKAIRTARGEAVSHSNAIQGWGPVAYALARTLRKTMRARPLPAQGGHNSLPL